ncbi:hypothetical protein CV102_18490 [Natronococcus pandeyae]|uniref:Aldehyde dehydrogenase domain-containing protein n=1 Tax=Natronococcus pandeyae TaxID=2055836 RepID=A0A8J8Q1K1_9EURY|nr:aldehyde dehydrogenase family protein [Natronococcus pandeyae]TYL37287.1 hypothetical protein CV102_18490 [Natronococcus pandeyae]
MPPRASGGARFSPAGDAVAVPRCPAWTGLSPTVHLLFMDTPRSRSPPVPGHRPFPDMEYTDRTLAGSCYQMPADSVSPSEQPDADDGTGESSPWDRSVEKRLADAREAQHTVATGSQETVDELTRIVHRLVCDDSAVVRRWAEHAVAETSQGDVSDKLEKTTTVVDLMYAEMEGERSVGVVTDPAADPVKIGKPVGVIGAHTPSTNCAATPVALALTAFKGGNALIISPSPFAVETCELVVADIQAALEREGFPGELIQSLSAPIRKARTEQLLTHADAIQVTGSPSQVERGETCGTPNYCVGAGNTVGIVDPTADLAATAEYIAHSAAFDNGLVCVCMSNLLIPPGLAEEFMAELEAAGGYRCSAAETRRLRDTLYTDERINPDCIGQPATEIASMAGFGEQLDGDTFLVPVFDDVDLSDPLVRENLSPVATLYTVPRDEVVPTTNAITSYQGAGHSCAIYGARDRAIELADGIDVCRICRNQSSIGLSVGEGNRVETSLSLGCGTWGGNQTDGNITYEQFTNTTTLYDRVPDSRPAENEATTAHVPRLQRLYKVIARAVQ